MLITNAGEQAVFSANQDQSWESSSTIKVPLLTLTLLKMAEQDRRLSDTMTRLPHHSTRGSGILNWMSGSSFSFRDLIYTNIVYSDCLATNIFLDYVGGQSKLNQWLQQQGLKTRLIMPYLYFTDEEEAMPRVGSTSAAEMLRLYRNLDMYSWPQSIRQLLKSALGNINDSWLEKDSPNMLIDLEHKTGSMIGCGVRGETVYNAVGSFNRNSQKYYFCILSHGFTNKRQAGAEDNFRRYICGYFSQSIAKLN